MSGLVGNHIVGFPTRRLICYRQYYRANTFIKILPTVSRLMRKLWFKPAKKHQPSVRHQLVSAFLSVVSTCNIVAEYVVAEYVKYPCGVRCCRYNSFKERVILILSYFKLIINRIVIKAILS